MNTKVRRLISLIVVGACVITITIVYQRLWTAPYMGKRSGLTHSLHDRDENEGFSNREVTIKMTDDALEETPAQALVKSNEASGKDCSIASNSTSNTYASWLEQQRARKELLRKTCDSYGNAINSDDEIEAVLNNKKLLNSLWVSEHDNVIYCPIGKVSCSSWRLLFMQLFEGPEYPKFNAYHVHSYRELEQHGVKQLKKYSQDEIVHMLQTYPRFMIVRHPYSRLHSAYIEKFTPEKNGHWNPLYPKNVGTKIIRRYWKDPSEDSLRTGHNVTFEDFLRYLSDKNVTQGKFDFHWTPFHSLCFPCQVRYDYVLKLETMENDSEHFLGCVLNTTLRLQEKNFVGHTDLSAYESIPKEYMDNLWEAYGKDFKLFGYTSPDNRI